MRDVKLDIRSVNSHLSKDEKFIDSDTGILLNIPLSHIGTGTFRLIRDTYIDSDESLFILFIITGQNIQLQRKFTIEALHSLLHERSALKITVISSAGEIKDQRYTNLV